MSGERWLLPDGIEELLPAEAHAVEQLRRELLDRCIAWGYQLVIPPMLEFTDSLLIGLGQDIDLLTFKVVDQLSGRMMGIRADMTPQVARIDAHSHARDGVSRFCYAGSVLHSKPRSPLATRSPLQLGAELYGDSSLSADCEVIGLMLDVLRLAGVGRVTLDLGHVGVYQALLGLQPMAAAVQMRVFESLQCKSVPDLEVALLDVGDPLQRQLLLELAHLHGDTSVLERAMRRFEVAAPAAVPAVQSLITLAGQMLARWPDLDLYFDLGELRGYHYHTGVVFAAYVAEHGQAVANGGRYDDVGAVFGRARPATGFNADLRALLPLRPAVVTARGAVSAPAAEEDPALFLEIARLRSAGETVITALSGSVDDRCDRELHFAGGRWQLRPRPCPVDAPSLLDDSLTLSLRNNTDFT